MIDGISDTLARECEQPSGDFNQGREEAMRRVLVSVLTITALGLPVLSQAETWDIDPAPTSAQFAFLHMMVSTVRGEFGKVNGTVDLDKQDPAKSSVEATIDT